MKIKYFQDTDTLHIEFRAAEVAETKDLDENTLLDLDKNGQICAITIEHASERAEIPKFPTSKLRHKHQRRRLSGELRDLRLRPISTQASGTKILT
jgi:uncharacterized protein YuzE